MLRSPSSVQNPKEMLSSHSIRRDQYGIPTVRNRLKISCAEDSMSFEKTLEINRWNELHKSLVSITANVRGLQQRIEFFENWLLRYLKPITYPLTHQSIDGIVDVTDDVSVESEFAALEDREKHAYISWRELLVALEILLRHVLSGIPDTFPENPDTFQPPPTLMRCWSSCSHTDYSDSLGFRCSGWTTCKPANSFTELQNNGILTTQKLQSHCEGKATPSQWISVCNNASWMLKYVNKTWKSTSCRIAIVSVPKLERLNILWARSDELVQQAGGNTYSSKHRGGVEFAWPEHYLVYGWIPAQCVIETFTLKDFRQLCKERDIEEEGVYVKHPHILLRPPPDSITKSIEGSLANAVESLQLVGEA